MSFVSKHFVRKRLEMIHSALLALPVMGYVNGNASGLFPRNPSQIFIEPVNRDTTPRITPRLKRLAKMYQYPLSQRARRNVSRKIQRITERWKYHPKEWRHACWCKACLS